MKTSFKRMFFERLFIFSSKGVIAVWVLLILCLIAALADVIGGYFTVLKRFNQDQMQIIIGLGAGFLLGATILDRLPESMDELPSVAPLCIMIGYLTLLFIDRKTGHHHGSHQTVKQQSKSSKSYIHVQQKAITITLIALLLHTFMDGVVIAGAFIINHSIGFLIFIAITMHKIPEGFTVASISLASGKTRVRAFLTSVSLAVTTLIGAIITIQFTAINAFFIKILMALATGTFLYISTTGMIPSIKEKRLGAMLAIIAGVAIFYLSLILIKAIGLN